MGAEGRRSDERYSSDGRPPPLPAARTSEAPGPASPEVRERVLRLSCVRRRPFLGGGHLGLGLRSDWSAFGDERVARSSSFDDRRAHHPHRGLDRERGLLHRHGDKTSAMLGGAGRNPMEPP